MTLRWRDKARRLQPQDSADYLVSRGWRTSGIWRGAQVWSLRVEGGAHEVLLPSLEAADYGARMVDLVLALEDVEARSAREIVEDIVAAMSDVIRVRVDPDDTTDGTIGLQRGAALHGHAYGMMLAAACGAASPRAFYANHKPADATKFVQGVRLGHPEAGSYVMRMLSPLPRDNALPGFDRPERSFPRRVVETLTSSVSALLEVAGNVLAQPDEDSLSEVVALGVSANLCSSIAGFAETELRHLDISVAWAPGRPQVGEAPSTVRVPQHALASIGRIGHMLKEVGPWSGVEVKGMPTKLESDDPLVVGAVVVRTVLEGRAINLHLELEPDDYRAALDAHKDKRAVSCVGDVEKKGKYYRMSRVTSFKVEEGENSV